MFFILEHKDENNRFKQLGVVVADSIDAAAAKVEMEIESAVGPPDCAASFAVLANNHYLSEMPEINSPASLTTLPEKVPTPKVIDRGNPNMPPCSPRDAIKKIQRHREKFEKE